MIAKREQYLAARHARPSATKVEMRSRRSIPSNADAALLILGIADRNPERQGPDYRAARSCCSSPGRFRPR